MTEIAQIKLPDIQTKFPDWKRLPMVTCLVKLTKLKIWRHHSILPWPLLEWQQLSPLIIWDLNRMFELLYHGKNHWKWLLAFLG